MGEGWKSWILILNFLFVVCENL